ncbi:MAG TPA: ATP-binding protein [Alphaproteobacteria bacterium]|nr:ATP-binding protein [Alphaproteobacteria bacterium]
MVFASTLTQTIVRMLRPADPSARLRLGIWAGVGSLLAVLWLLFVIASVQQFDVARRAAVSNTATLARLIEAWALSSLGRIDDLAAMVEPHLYGNPDDGHLAMMLTRQRQTNPTLFLAIDIVRPDGSVVASSATEPMHAAARNFDSDIQTRSATMIGLPRQVGDGIRIPILRTLTDIEGHPLGGLIVEVDPAYFAGFYSDLGLPADAAVMLFRADGPLLAANRPELGTLGRSYPENALWSVVRSTPAGAFETVDLDGVNRIVSYRANGAMPLIVSIGLSTESILADVLRRSIVNALIGLMLSLAVVLVTIFAVKQLARRAQTEQALRVAASAVASVGNGVAIVEADAARTVVQINPAFARLTGRPRGEVEGKDWDSLGITESALPWPDANRREAPAEMALETDFKRKDGSTFWGELRASPIRGESGQTTHVVFVLTDLSERKKAEDELVEAKDEAVAASRAKSEFLANMSHELRTPLNAIIGFADIIVRQLMGPVGTPRYVEYARDIWMSGSHLLEIISDILDLAKIEASQLALDEQLVDLAKVFAACRTLAAERVARAGVEIAVDCPESLPQLRGDELRIKQIVLNLLTNAVKFSERGGRVDLRARLDGGGGLVVEVQDRGCGMSEDELWLALQPFRQVSSSVAKRGEGTGLGLPLVVRLAELHGGQLDIRTAPGEGTTATIRFPPARTHNVSAAA